MINVKDETIGEINRTNENFTRRPLLADIYFSFQCYGLNIIALMSYPEPCHIVNNVCHLPQGE